MQDSPLDEVDRAILYELQQDARNHSNAEIADRVGMSASAVGKRIRKLEERGVIKGYGCEIDFGQAGFPLQMLFICSTSITEREALIQEALEIETVVSVREMMTGQRNVHILTVGQTHDDITAAAQRIDDIGFTVTDEILLRGEYSRPSIIFEQPQRGPGMLNGTK